MNDSRKPLAKFAEHVNEANRVLDVPKQGAEYLVNLSADKLESAVLTTRYTAEAMVANSEARLSGLVDGSLSAAKDIIDSIEPVVWSLADDSITLSRGLIDSAAGQLKAQVEHLLEEVR